MLFLIRSAASPVSICAEISVRSLICSLMLFQNPMVRRVFDYANIQKNSLFWEGLDVEVALRERNLDAVCIEGIVDEFLGTGGIGEVLVDRGMILPKDMKRQRGKRT